MGKIKILCIFTRILGGKTFSNKLIFSLDKIKYVDAQYLFYDYDDYIKYPAPRILKLSSSMESAWRIREKYVTEICSAYDILLFQSLTLTLPFLSIINKKPTAVALDTTPVLAHELILKENDAISVRVKSSIANLIWKYCINRIFKKVDIFLPRTYWCAKSLIDDFKISNNNVYVTYSPIDLEIWKPINKIKQDKTILLFVGNDFYRKGGKFLLNLFQTHLTNSCKLRIVSNDAVLDDNNINGVEIIRGLTHNHIENLINIYQTSDIFLFPTNRDQLGLVLTEATAVGLPIIARDVGGIRELVINEYNGFLMPYESTINEWADNIMLLVNDNNKLLLYSNNSRNLAMKLLDQNQFDDKINAVINRLISLL